MELEGSGLTPRRRRVRASAAQVVNAGAFAYDKSPDLEYLDIPVVDSRETDLGQYFEESNRFIDAARAAAHGHVLVHCRAGRFAGRACVLGMGNEGEGRPSHTYT